MPRIDAFQASRRTSLEREGESPDQYSLDFGDDRNLLKRVWKSDTNYPGVKSLT